MKTQHIVWMFRSCLAGLLILVSDSCKEDTTITLPALTTHSVTQITASSAISGGSITDNGNGNIVSSGIVWSKRADPTSDKHDGLIENQMQNDAFVCEMSDLAPETTYYVKAFAVNDAGTAYGNEVQFSTLKATPLPVVSTSDIGDITLTTAIAGGIASSIDGTLILSRGIAYSMLTEPTIADSIVSAGEGAGSFTVTIRDLSPATKYFVRAYATNRSGTAYGNQVTFNTLLSVRLPSVYTSEIYPLNPTTAEGGGNVTSSGGVPVTARGLAYSTAPEPTTADSIVSAGDGMGSFTATITGLRPGDTYYVRAYATNSIGTAYGNERQFTTQPAMPVVTTDTISNIGQNTATGGGNVTDDGGASVTARGIVYSTHELPTIADNIVSAGEGTGSFTAMMTDLQPGFTYYVRAYATNSVGTAYGSEEPFVTLDSDTEGSFIDSRDGQRYKYIIIGEQVWMAENLKYLPSVVGSEAGSQTTPYYYVGGYPGTDVAAAKAQSSFRYYGVLYNWPAAMAGTSSSSKNPGSVQGACPPGWHLPSDAEWTRLIEYVVDQGYPNQSDDPNGAGNALRSCRQENSPLGGGCNTSWPPSWSSNDTHFGLDVFGFSALPTYSRTVTGNFSFARNVGFWWSATEYSSSNAWFRDMRNTCGDVNHYHFDKSVGWSVRCIRDN